MEIKINYKYREGYLPTPRCRKLRYRDAENITTITIPEISKEEAPVAFILKNWRDKKEYKLYKDKLYTKVEWSKLCCGEKGLLPLSELHWYIRGISDYWNYTKEEIEKSYHDYAQKYLIIDGIVYTETGEPRYVSMTFGLGHNHGGTSLMVDEYYNSNISKACYFNALDRKKAIKFTKERAINRGDTEYVDNIGKFYNIKVLIPEAVKCNPQKEAGEGDPFLNTLDKITESSSSSSEAAILGLCALASEIKG